MGTTTEGFNIFKCEWTNCSYKSVNRSDVDGHIDTVHKGKKFHCPHCDKSISTKGALKVHIDNVHKRIQIFSCDQCVKSYKSKSQLESHTLRVHMNIKQDKVVCPHCGKKYVDTGMLNRHIKIVHEKAPKLIKCEDCEKAFHIPAQLKKHRAAVHRSDKRLQCKECNKAFGGLRDLQLHI